MDILFYGQRSSLSSSLTECLRTYWPATRLVLVDPAAPWPDVGLPALSIIDHRGAQGDPAELVSRVRARYLAPVILVGPAGAVDPFSPVVHSGADDFLEEPFRPKEALARIWMLLRRISPAGLIDEPAQRPVPKVGVAVL